MKILHTHTLVGKTRRLKEIDLSSNFDKLQKTINLVKDQFGDRPLVVVNEDRLVEDLGSYPEVFIAGWFRSAAPDENGNIQELVVIDHSYNMDAARKSLLENIKSVWNDGARNVQNTLLGS